MSLPNYLAKIKSSGVYRYVFDKSEVPASERESIRLIVGYSEKGPFNTAVYVSDASDFIATFGGISRRMERKGIFFHRLALQALEAGPILALNIKPFNADRSNYEESSVYAFNASDVNPSYHFVNDGDYGIITSQTYPTLLKDDYNTFVKNGLAFGMSDINYAATDDTVGASLFIKKFENNDYNVAMLAKANADAVTGRAFHTMLDLSGFNEGQRTADTSTEYKLADGVSTVRLANEVTLEELDIESAEDNLPYYFVKIQNPKSSYDVMPIYELLNTKTGQTYHVYTLGGSNTEPVMNPNIYFYDNEANGFSVMKFNYGESESFYGTIGIWPAGSIMFDITNGSAITIDGVEYASGKLGAIAVCSIYTDAEAGWQSYATRSSYALFTLGDLSIPEADLPEHFLGFFNLDSDYDFTEVTKITSTTGLDASLSAYNAAATKSSSAILVSDLESNIDYVVGNWGDSNKTKKTDLMHYVLDPEGTYNESNLYNTIESEVGDYTSVLALAVEGETIHSQAGLAYVASPTPTGSGNPITAIYDTNRFWKVDAERLHDISVTWSKTAIDDLADEDYVRIVETSSQEDSTTVFIRPYVPTNWNVTISDWFASETADEMPPYLAPIKDHYLSEFFVDVFVFGGNMCNEDLFASTGTLGMYNAEGTWQPFCNVLTDAKGLSYVTTNPNVVNSYGDKIDVLETMADTSTSNFIGRYTGIMFPNFKDASGTFIDIASVFNSDYETHKLLLHMNEALLDDASDYDLNDDGYYIDPENKPEIHGHKVDSVSAYVHALCSTIVPGNHPLIDLDGNAIVPEYDPAGKAVAGIYMKGYTYYSIQKSDKGEGLYKKIIDVLNYKGIREALTNNVDIDYKYIIDTFTGYPGLNMKSEFSTIAKAKFNCLAIVNFPPMNDVIKHFGYKAYDGSFDMSILTKRRFDITLPPESQGASWAAFYTQLQMTDGSSKFVVPSAALVSNLYMDKRAKRLPYYIVAGPNYGRIVAGGVLGPDYNYSRSDLDVLEPFGVNAIIYIPRKGTVINSNQTAKQTPVTALSKIHVRELVTFIQDEVENMLYGYQWELNTPSLRDAIRTKCETILGLVQANGGIYDYRVQCDSQNNTPEIIDNEMVVVDLEVEAARGAGKMVQTLTLHRTGGIAATPRS